METMFGQLLAMNNDVVITNCYDANFGIASNT